MNKRKTKRYIGNYFIEAKWISGATSTTGVAVNLSKKGVGICCLSPLEIGSKISITFHFDDEQKQTASESVQGQVRWTKKLGPFHTAGIEFFSELNEENNFLLLSQIEQAKEFED